MQTNTGQRRQLKIAAFALLISILLNKYLISQIFPELSELIGINPMPVILGVPVDMTLMIGFVPVFILFSTLYLIFILPYQQLNDGLAWKRAKKKLWTVSAGIAAIPFWMIISGSIYYFAHDQIPRSLRNSIESFGLNLDIYSLYPGNDIIHFRGSLFMLIGFLIGAYIFMRKIKTVTALSNLPYPAKEETIKPVPGGIKIATNPSPSTKISRKNFSEDKSLYEDVHAGNSI